MAPADFQKATSLRQSAGVPEPHDVHTSMPIAFGSRPSARVSPRSFSNTSMRALVRRIGVRHPAVAPLRNARQRRVIPATLNDTGTRPDAGRGLIPASSIV